MVNNHRHYQFKSTHVKTLVKSGSGLGLRPRHQLFGWLTKQPPRRLQQRAIWYYGRQESKRWWRWLIVLIVLVLGTLIWLLLFSPAFKLTDIQVNGLRRFSVQEIKLNINPILQERYLGILPKDNYFLLPKKALIKQLLKITVIEDVKIKPILFHGLRVDIKERIASVVWQRGDRFAEVDLNGLVIKDLATSTIAELPLVVDVNLEPLKLGINVVDAAVVKLVIDAQKDLLNIKIKNFIFTSEPQQLIILTDRGWQVILTTQQPLIKQQQALDTILSSLSTDQQQRIDYIDVRLPDLPTYKLK